MNGNDGSKDRRAHPRKKMIKRAKIVYQDGNCLMDCLVADLSDGGVKLKHTDIFRGGLAVKAARLSLNMATPPREPTYRTLGFVCRISIDDHEAAVRGGVDR